MSELDHNHNLDCARCDEQLVDYVYDELDDTARALVRRHIEGCDKCANAAEGLAHTRGMMSQLAIEEVPVGLHERVLDAARQAAARPAVARQIAAGPREPSRARDSLMPGETGGLWRWLDSIFRVTRMPAFGIAMMAVVVLGVGLYLANDLREAGNRRALDDSLRAPVAATPSAAASGEKRGEGGQAQAPAPEAEPPRATVGRNLPAAEEAPPDATQLRFAVPSQRSTAHAREAAPSRPAPARPRTRSGPAPATDALANVPRNVAPAERERGRSISADFEASGSAGAGAPGGSISSGTRGTRGPVQLSARTRDQMTEGRFAVQVPQAAPPQIPQMPPMATPSPAPATPSIARGAARSERILEQQVEQEMGADSSVRSSVRPSGGAPSYSPPGPSSRQFRSAAPPSTQQAPAVAPSSSTSLLAQAQAKMQRGDYAGAAADLNRLLERPAGEYVPTALLLLARSNRGYLGCGAALATYRRLTEGYRGAPEASEALLEQAHCQEQLGRLDDARASLDRAEGYRTVQRRAQEQRVRMERRQAPRAGEVSEPAQAVPTQAY